jgi:hypothetical protein
MTTLRVLIGVDGFRVDQLILLFLLIIYIPVEVWFPRLRVNLAKVWGASSQELQWVHRYGYHGMCGNGM